MRNRINPTSFVKGLAQRATEIAGKCSLDSEFQSMLTSTFRWTEQSYGSRKYKRKWIKEIENAQLEFRFKRHNERAALPWRSIVCFSIISWYIPTDTGIMLREAILKEKNRYSLEDQTVIDLLLISKAQTELFLIETSLWTSAEFFGNILTDSFEVFYHYQGEWPDRRTLTKKSKVGIDKLLYSNVVWMPPRPKAVQRKRGYTDHGTLPEQHKPALPGPDEAGLKQQRIEEARISQQQSISLYSQEIRNEEGWDS